MLRKAEYHVKAASEENKMQDRVIVQDHNFKEEVSEMSNNSVKELCVCFYPCITNDKGKSYKKSR